MAPDARKVLSPQVTSSSELLIQSAYAGNRDSVSAREHHVHIIFSVGCIRVSSLLSLPVNEPDSPCTVLPSKIIHLVPPPPQPLLRLSMCVGNTQRPSGSPPPTSRFHHRASAVVTAVLPWEHLFQRRALILGDFTFGPQSLIRCATHKPPTDQLLDVERVETPAGRGL
ncbi:hypothetical protein CRENBAI_012344 [Crenichthys baileyi]|uniref:Uncharacterized protein n=1 Tax=Crenichthys baileyi TaxID=28760 RepID=A0AAV9S7S9_9TELE